MIFFGMNALVLFASIGIDSQLCGRLCLMLAHSVWQVGLLALIATLVTRFQRKENPELGYAVSVGALLVGLAALPITYSLVEIDPQVTEVSRSAAANLPSVVPIVQPQVEQILPPSLPMVRSGPSTSAVPVAISKESQVEPILLRFAPWMAGCYAVGVLVMLTRLGQGIWKSHRLACNAKPVGDNSLNHAFQRLAQTWSLRVIPVLGQAHEIIVPQVVGLLRPTILLPTSALSGLSPEELEMILAHELAHVRRYDMWVNLLQRLAESILFFNPALWYLSRRVSAYREYCCDEETCRVKQDEAATMRLRYAQALLHVVELSGKDIHSVELAGLAATGAGPSELRQRVARLFGEPLREPIGLSRNAILSLITGFVLVIAGPAAWQNAAESQPNADSASEEKFSKTKVEVVAIGTHDEEPQRWWDANGKVLNDLSFTWNSREKVSSDEKVWRRVVVRVQTPQRNGEDADITWQIVGSRAAGGGNIEFIEGFEPGNYLTRFFSLAEGKETFDVRVGITTGPWKKVAESNGMGSSAHGTVDKKSVVFSAPMANGDGTSIVVSHNFFDRACRVVAIDRGGKVHDSGGRGGASAGEIYQMPATFRGLALEQIDHFELQTREYEWTEIKNLPVEPGKKVAISERKTRGLLEEFSLLTADSGLSAVTSNLAEFSWCQADRYDQAQVFAIGSQRDFWNAIAKRFDEATDFPGAFAGILEGIYRDPYGPQLDLGQAVEDQLGKQILVAESDDTWLLVWAAKKPNEVAKTLAKFAAADPDWAPTKVGNFGGWCFRNEADNNLGAIFIMHDSLVVVSHVQIFEQIVLLDVAAAGQQMIVKVVDEDDNPVSGAKVFRNLTFKDKKNGSKIENEDYFSNDEGEAVVALASEPLKLNLWVSKPGYVPMVSSWTEEQKKDGDRIPLEFEFRMHRGTKISGIVTNVAGIPIPGVKVEVTENIHDTRANNSDTPKPFKRPGRSHWLAWGSAGVTTDAGGRWTVENIPSDEELNSVKYDSPERAPLLLRFSHPDYETIEGIEDYQTVWNPTLEQLRAETARTVMNWVDKENHGRENAIRLEQGETYENADFHGRHFARQDLMVWSDRMFKSANLTDSVWEDMLIPAMDSSFQETDFSGSRLINMQLPGKSGAFQNAIFNGALLESTNLSGGVSAFQEARFDEASITNCNIEGGASAFQVASFRGAKFQSSKLTGSGPALQNANLDDAKVVKTAIVCDSPTAFQGSSLNNTEFVEAELSSIDAQALASCEFQTATPPRYDAKTKFPKGFDPEEQGWTLIK